MELVSFELVGYVVYGRVRARDSRMRVSGFGFRGLDSPAGVGLWVLPVGFAGVCRAVGFACVCRPVGVDRWVSVGGIRR